MVNVHGEEVNKVRISRLPTKYILNGTIQSQFDSISKFVKR